MLGDERAIGALKIVGLHADRLCLRLGLDGLVEAHRPFGNELRLGDAVGESRARRNPARQGQRFLLQRVGGDQPVVKAPGFAFLRRHGAAGVKQFGGAALADDARQDRTRPHVAAGEPDPVEQERGLRGGRGEAQIRGHGDDGAGAGGDAVDRGDDRLAAMEHGLDQVAGHARERQQLIHLHGNERADDLMHVAAGAEIAAIGQ